MAKIIEKIVVDTSQHDEKLRKAKSELRSYASTQQGMETMMKGVTATVGKFAAAIGIAMTATDGFKKVINASETTADEYGRVMQSVTTVTENFFYALNTGNLNNFFSNLQTSIAAARELYDALDDVGSIKMNNRAAIAIQERLLRELRVRKQRGENVDAQILTTQGRIASLKGQEVTATRRAAVQSVVTALSDTMDKETAQKVASQLFARGQDYFREMQSKYNELRAKGMGTVQISQGSSLSGATSSSMARAFSKDNLSKTDRKIYEAVEAIVNKESKLGEAIGLWADAENLAANIAQQDFMAGRWAGAGSGGKGGSGKGGTTKDTESEILRQAKSDIKFIEDMIDAEKAKMSGKLSDALSLGFEEVDIENSSVLEGDLAAIEQVRQKMEEAEEQAAFTKEALLSMFSNISRVGSNMDMPALNIMGTLAQAIATMILGYTEATVQAAKFGPIAWAAFALSGLAQVTSIVAQIKSIGKFAEGGLAYGPTLGLFGEYSGASHNPEVVAPLDKLRNIIGEGGAVGQVEFHIQGKELRGVLKKADRINTRNA